MEKAKKVHSGLYIYRGYKIQRHPADGMWSGAKYIWEVEDHDGSGFGHSKTLREAKREVDDEIKRETLCT